MDDPEGAQPDGGTGVLPVWDAADLSINGWRIGRSIDGHHPALVIECEYCEDHTHAIAFPPGAYIAGVDGELVAENLMFFGPRKPGPPEPG